MAEFILEAREVDFSYPDGTQALRAVSLAVERGKKVAILGPNGAGKSTLFLHFNGILHPGRGRIRFAGNDVLYDRHSLMALRRNVGIVFQDPETQLFSASVLQEISFGPLNLGLDRQQVLARVHRAMTDAGISALQDRPTHFLSYGEKKRVSIADILAMEPAVIICDEPTAWLDPSHATQIMELLDRINRQGTTVILSTHDVSLAYSWADYAFVMNKGRVIGEGRPEEIFQQEKLLQEADLEKPWLLEVYFALQRKGWIDNSQPLPKTKRDLFARI